MTPAPFHCLLLVALVLSGCGRGEPPAADNAASKSAATPGATRDPGATVASKLREERAWALQLPALTDAEIPTALEQADAALAEGRIERGVGATPGALELNLAVLALEPENVAARAGLERTLEAMFERGRIAMRDGRLVEAGRIAEVAERVMRGHRDLDAYQQLLAQAREADTTTDAAVFAAKRGRFGTGARDAPALFARALGLVRDYAPALRERERWQRSRLEAAWRAAEAGRFADATTRIAEAARLRADAPALLEMRLRIAELREARTQAMLAAGQRAVRALELDKADTQLRAAEQIAAQPAGVEALREAIFLARHYGPFAPGQTVAEKLAGGGKGPELVVIPFGSFRMGDDDDKLPQQGPARDVAFARGFALSRAEITVADFRRFVAATGYRTHAERQGHSTVFDERGGSPAEHEGVDWRRDFLGRVAAEDRPVTHVAFEDAQAYADWLSKQTGARYRLPSEAEWEYVVRAGSRERYPWGPQAPPPARVGNLSGEGDKSSAGRSWGTPIRGYTDFFWGTAPVRSFPAEPWGTFDMVGNVSEWVLDCWHDSYRRAPVDGSAWVNPGCPQRVVRGASWASSLEQARSAARMPADATSTLPWVGFRVVREI